MNAVELAVEKVKGLDEARAWELLAWLQARELPTPATRSSPRGARAMLGFARRCRPQVRSTTEWMSDIREGERD
ncbi:MAG: hypothetical protein M5U12_24530 [Verrucomicrobia bacterium]|nr:hypothetical protein [Verrucomicrobiota bacterium]